MRLTPEQIKKIRERVNSHLAEYPNIGGDMPDLLDTIDALEQESSASVEAALREAPEVKR
jgi:hypothetical protein